MKGIRLLIDTRYAAFSESPHWEISRILRELSERIDEGVFPENLVDINGNTVGYVYIEEDDTKKPVTPQVEVSPSDPIKFKGGYVNQWGNDIWVRDKGGQ